MERFTEEQKKEAVEMYRTGVKACNIKKLTGLNISDFDDYITNDIENERKIRQSLGNWPEEWDKARFKLLGKKKE